MTTAGRKHSPRNIEGRETCGSTLFFFFSLLTATTINRWQSMMTDGRRTAPRTRPSPSVFNGKKCLMTTYFGFCFTQLSGGLFLPVLRFFIFIAVHLTRYVSCYYASFSGRPYVCILVYRVDYVLPLSAREVTNFQIDWLLSWLKYIYEARGI